MSTKEQRETIEKGVELMKKVPWLWLRNENGEASASLTLAFTAFVVCTLWVLASIVESAGDVTFRSFDPAVAAAYLTPCLMLYWGRRKTRASESKTNVEVLEKTDD